MRIGICQMTSTADILKNLHAAERLVREAAACGAEFVCLPEYFSFYGEPEEWKRVAAEETPRIIGRMSDLAAELGIHLCLGSVLEDLPDSDKCANTSILLDPEGREVARYRKRHLFDVDLPDSRRRESEYLIPGKEPTVCNIAGWTIGLSICFDLRFPSHYQELRRIGAELILIPAAFTAFTGKDHWEPLLRARAIETQCCVAAAAQCGECGGGKTCHGHSAVIGPWGEVLAGLENEPGVALADLDRDEVARVRQMMPLG